MNYLNQDGLDLYDELLKVDLAEITSNVSDLKSAFDNIASEDYSSIKFTIASTGYIKYADGTADSSSTSSYTDYIDISAYTKIKYKRQGAQNPTSTSGMAFYDVNKVYISGISTKTNQSSSGYLSELEVAEVPDNAVYARFTTYTNTTERGFFELYGLPILVSDVIKNNSYTKLSNRAYTFERGILTGNVDGSTGNEQSSDYGIRSKNSLFLKAGAKIVCNDNTLKFRAFEFSWYNSGWAGLITRSDFVDEYTVKNDCYVRLSVNSKTSNTVVDLKDSFKYFTVYGFASLEHTPNLFVSDKCPNSWFSKDSIHYDTIWNVSLDDFYARYDSLVSAFPSYITKENLGKDASNTYDIFAYKFEPYQVIAENETGTSYNVANQGQTFLKSMLPKIIITTCLHGFERPIALAMQELMYDVCYNWSGNEHLDFLRHHVSIYVIPVANPYGFVNKVRYNSNHVDLNRNFNTSLWSKATNGSTDPTDERYRGASAASEAETQIVQNFLQRFLNATSYFDFHTHGVLTGYSYMTHFSCGDSPNFDIRKLQILGNDVTLGLTASGYAKDQYGETVSTIGLLGIGATTSTAAMYAKECGIMSATPEGMYRIFPEGETEHPSVASMANDSVLTTEAKELNTEYIANIMLEAYRLFANNDYLVM